MIYRQRGVLPHFNTKSVNSNITMYYVDNNIILILILTTSCIIYTNERRDPVDGPSMTVVTGEWPGATAAPNCD